MAKRKNKKFVVYAKNLYLCKDYVVLCVRMYHCRRIFLNNKTYIF